jgi:hypothetical protein
MKKMNKMYEAPKAEMVELNVNKGFMIDDAGTYNAGSFNVEETQTFS